MRIRNPKLLKSYRGAGSCDVCGLFVRNRQPHHILTRGGGGSDVALGLLAVCFAFQGGSDCHERIHAGSLTIRGRRLTREDLLEIVSRKYGIPADSIEAELYALRRLPKGSPYDAEGRLRELREQYRR